MSEVGRSKPAPQSQRSYAWQIEGDGERETQSERERGSNDEGKAKTESRGYEGGKGSTWWWRKERAKPRGKEGGTVGEKESVRNEIW